jgi:transposase
VGVGHPTTAHRVDRQRDRSSFELGERGGVGRIAVPGEPVPTMRALNDAPAVSSSSDPPTSLRLSLLRRHATAIAELDRQDREAAGELRRLARATGSTLDELCGIAARIQAELLVEVGDPRRFTGEGGFARFNGTAPLPASSAEGDNEPVRHRLNRGGNRRVNACLHRIAVTQLRCSPRARRVYDDARRHGHTKKEAMRILKRHLSDVVYRHMTRDLQRQLAAADPPLRAA